MDREDEAYELQWGRVRGRGGSTGIVDDDTWDAIGFNGAASEDAEGAVGATRLGRLGGMGFNGAASEDAEGDRTAACMVYP